MEVYEFELVTTPLYKYYKLYDHMKSDISNPEYKWMEGLTSYILYRVNNSITEEIEQMCIKDKMMIRFKEVNYPRFHEPEWQKTNKVTKL